MADLVPGGTVYVIIYMNNSPCSLDIHVPWNLTRIFFSFFSATDQPFSFANAGAPVFGAAQGDDHHRGDDEYDPHYEPIISLPDIGNISTGEEDEEEMFRHRAKLYRYDRDAKAWKERGVGDIKIHWNPKTGRARVLMRRDQIFKVCSRLFFGGFIRSFEQLAFAQLHVAMGWSGAIVPALNNGKKQIP